MKRVFKGLFLLTILLVLASCDLMSTSKRIDNPRLRFKDNVLSWEYVDDAYLYIISANENELMRVSTNSYDLSILEPGTYTITVQALSDNDEYLDSDLSFIKVTVKENTPIIVDPPIEEKPTNYSVFMINDTHGAFYESSFPSIARVGSIIDDLDENTIKIMNGDAFQGSYESNKVFGLSMLEALNALDFDCFVLGNHEFDWGLDVIRQYADGDLTNGEADFPFVACNVIDKSTNQLVDFLEPYYIKDIDGLRVGIIGLIGYNEESSILAPNVVDYDFVYPYELIKSYILELKTEQNCDSVLISIHDYDENLNQKIADLTGNYQVDGILCGHTHEYIVEDLSNRSRIIPVVQNSSQNRTAIKIDFEISDHSYKVKTYYPSNYPESHTLDEVFAKYQYLKEEADLVLKYNSNYISKSSLGSVAVKVMKDEFNADLAILNTAGVRNYISSNITVGAIFNVFPFNNEVVITYLKGSELQSLYQNNGSYLYFSDFDFNHIDKNKNYKIAVIDYVFYGTYYDEFHNVEYENTHTIMRDLVIEYYKK